MEPFEQLTPFDIEPVEHTQPVRPPSWLRRFLARPSAYFGRFRFGARPIARDYTLADLSNPHNMSLSLSDLNIVSDSDDNMSDTTILPQHYRTVSPEPITQPVNTPPPTGELEHGCIACSSMHDLTLCRKCRCAYICDKHVGSALPNHYTACLNIRRADRRLSRQRFIASMLEHNVHIPQYPPEGERAVETATRALGYATAAAGTQLGMMTALNAYYESSAITCREHEFFEERFVIPKTLLKLGRLEECYNYVKHWTRFAGLQQRAIWSGEYQKPTDGTSLWEGSMMPILPRGGGTTLNCLLTVLMIKLTLMLNIQEVQAARIVERKKELARETIDQIQMYLVCDEIRKEDVLCRDVLYSKPKSAVVEKLGKDIFKLRDAIFNGNRHFWGTFESRNTRHWSHANTRDIAQGPQVQDGGLASSLDRRGDVEEAAFAVYNNKELLNGHLGKAVQCVFLKRHFKDCCGGWFYGLYGPKQGWLN